MKWDIYVIILWSKVFRSGLSKFCGRQPLKNLLSTLLSTLSHICILLYPIKEVESEC